MKIEDGTCGFNINGINIKVTALNNVIQGIGISLAGHALTGQAAIDRPHTWLYTYFRDFINGDTEVFGLELEWRKLTPFQKSVYVAAASIPYGSVTTYQELAEKIGGKKYARAVGTALSKNPFPLAIPCHRVLPKNSGIENPGGFAGGTTLKKKLLKIEEEISRRRHCLFMEGIRSKKPLKEILPLKE